MTRLVTNVAHALRGSAVTLGRSAAIILGVDDIWCARRRRRRGVEGCVRAAGVGSSARGARTAAESPSAVTFRGNCHRAEGGGGAPSNALVARSKGLRAIACPREATTRLRSM